MSKLLRHHRASDTCFITAVTHNRQPILADHSDLLTAAIRKYSAVLRFGLLAYVILPDHFHALIECNGNDLSGILGRVKLSFSKHYRNRAGISASHIWQRRFWDHIIRDQDDMNRHIDYIHYNPVKHRMVESPFEWPLSSIHEYRREGFYTADWGRREIEVVSAFGE